MNTQNKKGFTLVELIIVIAIIGILAGVLFPTITGYLNNAKESAAMQEAAGYETAYETWLVEVESGSTITFGAYVVNIEMLSATDVNESDTVSTGTLKKLEPLTDGYKNGFRLVTDNEMVIEGKFDQSGKFSLNLVK